MCVFDSVFSHLTVSRRLVDRLDDVDLRAAFKASGKFWGIFNNLPGKYWESRGHRIYGKNMFGKRLLKEFKINSFDDYLDFMMSADEVKRCESRFKLTSFMTKPLENGPGTEPLIRGRTSLNYDQILWSTSSEGSVVTNPETEKIEILTSNHENIIFFGETYFLGWATAIGDNETFLSLYSAQDLRCLNNVKSDTEYVNVFISSTDKENMLTLTTQSDTNENGLAILRIFTLTVISNEIILEMKYKKELSPTENIVSFSMFNDEIFCLSGKNDINRRELAVYNTHVGEFEYLNMEALIKKSHLDSELLKNDGFTCWSPIEMASCSHPVFVIAFGCKMRFRSFYSGVAIFRECRSACFAKFTDSTRSRLEFFYIPEQYYFDLFVHDGFVQIHANRNNKGSKIKSFGNFYKFVECSLKPFHEVCPIPIKEDLDNFFPQENEKVGFSISGTASNDAFLLAIRTWPARSAADISVKYRLVHVKFLPESIEDEPLSS